jgi:hypothetical protein
MGVVRNSYKSIKLENLIRRDHLGQPFIHGRIVLKWIIKKQGVEFD